MENKCINVGTHNGTIHMDESMASAIVQEYYGKINITRTRDNNILSEMDLVFDVGGGKFDHHSKDKEYRKNGVPYAACGLIWREFGRKLIGKKRPSLSSEDVDLIFNNIDKYLLQGIEAYDNGYDIGKTDVPTVSISDYVNLLNPNWTSKNSEDKAFKKTVKFAREVLINTLKMEFSSLKAKKVIEKSYKTRTNKNILFLNIGCEWVKYLHEIDKNEEVLFVVFKDKNEGYKLQVVPKELGSFKARKDLPSKWGGLRDEEFSRVAGIKDGIFCHPALFLAGTKTKESAIYLAEQALNNG